MGSARYVAQLSDSERSRIALNINLDSVAGGARLAALSSGFAALEPFLLAVADANRHDLRCVRPLMTNSDHANFAAHGIPALRLIAGFGSADSHLRLLLTAADTRDKVRPEELETALHVATVLASEALMADEATLEGLANNVA